MWTQIAKFIIKNRLILIIFVAVVTVLMLLLGSPERAYDYSSTVPTDDPDYQYFVKFKQQFGEDGNILAIGIQDSSIYQLEAFKSYDHMAEQIKKVEGVKQVLALSKLQYLHKDTSKQSFVMKPVFEEMPKTQEVLNQKLAFVNTLEFYKGQIFNQKNGALVLLVSIEGKVLNSAQREVVMAKIQKITSQFEKQNKIKLRYAGLPFVRSTMATKVTAELRLFLGLSLLITALVLFFFFRSLPAVVFPIIVIGVIVVWTMGTLQLLDYKITLLTGLLPPVLVVIGIPNCVYMITKFHQEFRKHGDKILAMTNVIKKIGVVSLMTNITTAVGFIVLGIANITIMKEFGIVAAINIGSTFLISMILIPAIFSYLPSPKPSHLKHLDGKLMQGIIKTFDHWVFHHRPKIFVATAVIILLSAYGMYRIVTVSHMVDELPQKSQVRQDLAFFEKNFNGVMPLELIIDTGTPKGIRSMSNLKKIDQFQQSMDSLGVSSPALSMITFLKASRQAFYNDTAFYDLPDSREYAFLMKYLKNGQGSNSSMANAFVDSTGRQVRISMKIADMGSIKIDSLISHQIRPTFQKIFKDKPKLKLHVTGTTSIFMTGNQYLIANLKMTIALAVLIVGIIMSILFRSVRMILVVVFSNCVPMLITAGIMGYFGIPLKPSTALIFSIAFGISVDDAIHFLARYKQELIIAKGNKAKAIRVSLAETGQGMLYTSIILFFGFIIFTASSFGGTIALGTLTSLTLILAMLTNLILLPALLLIETKNNA